MPIRPELKPLYPLDWPEISRRIRFERAQGRCENCGRPHGHRIPQRSDGTWLAPDGRWYDDIGEPAWPEDLFALIDAVQKRVILATAHLDHDPANSKDENLAALCGRCHLAHDRPEHLRRKRIYRRARYAVADLFEGEHLPVTPEPALAGFEVIRNVMTKVARYAAARKAGLRTRANSPDVMA